MEVAQGTVVQPMSRDMHNTKMSEAVMKVRLTTVLTEFRDIDPPWNLREPKRTTWSLEIVSSGSCNGRRPRFVLGMVFRG